jgi:hypothetical protein
MSYSSFDRYQYPFNWNEFQRACQLNQEALISRKVAIAKWKRLVSREHRRICDCPDYRLHLFPTWPDPPCMGPRPREIPRVRGAASHLRLPESGVEGGGLRPETGESKALAEIVQETLAGWEKWSIEEEEVMAVEDRLEAVDDFVVAGGSAGGGGVVAQETPSTRPPVIVPSGRPYHGSKGV